MYITQEDAHLHCDWPASYIKLPQHHTQPHATSMALVCAQSKTHDSLLILQSLIQITSTARRLLNLYHAFILLFTCPYLARLARRQRPGLAPLSLHRNLSPYRIRSEIPFAVAATHPALLGDRVHLCNSLPLYTQNTGLRRAPQHRAHPGWASARCAIDRVPRICAETLGAG